MNTTYLDNGSTIRDEDFFVFAETVPHIVWMCDADGSVEYLNRRGIDYVGGPGPRLAEEWFNLLHPDDVEHTVSEWRSKGDPTAHHEVDCRLRRTDGEYRWHHIQALALRDSSGKLRNWIGVATDVDDERRGQDQLRASERATAEALVLLETLQFNAPVGFGFVDLDLRVVRENELLASFRHGAVVSHLGRPLEAVEPDLWTRLEPIFEMVIATGEAVLNQEFTTTVEGDPARVRHLLHSYYPVRVDDEIMGVGVVAVDVTERKEAEQAQQELTVAAVSAIAASVEARDPYTAGHQRRVATIAAAIATELGLPPDEVQAIRLAAGIHDIGKLGIPAEILSCPRRLTVPEFELVKTHAQLGHDIVAGIRFKWPIRDMIVQHHERLDGTGYPNGLRGDEILLGARIIAVADTVEAMSSHRPYRPAIGIEAALAEITRTGGKLFDAMIVDACVRLFDDCRLAVGALD